MNCGQRSGHREVPNPERSNLREVTETASIRINQEVPTELTASTENKQNAGLALEIGTENIIDVNAEQETQKRCEGDNTDEAATTDGAHREVPNLKKSNL